MKAVLQNVSVRAVMAAVPEQVINNSDLNFDPRTKHKIIKNTGIQSRHVIGDKTSLLPMHGYLGKKTMKELNWLPESIDGIIVVTQYPEFQLPATACLLHDLLKLPKDTIAYDISMGCSGYVYGLFNAMGNMTAGGGGRHFKKGSFVCG